MNNKKTVEELRAMSPMQLVIMLNNIDKSDAYAIINNDLTDDIIREIKKDKNLYILFKCTKCDCKQYYKKKKISNKDDIFDINKMIIAILSIMLLMQLILSLQKFMEV